ncbi:MAG: helicase-exonuclease AddAB subunit AddB, partial [Clostridiales bacterium]|nr:helicase-exonuclease AddAB subunit AddB [Clostridiales bacterium]
RPIQGLQYQLQKGVFKPSHFERLFSITKDFVIGKEGVGGSMRLNGRIDRIDTYEDETKLYVKIIDYKTGNKDFDLEEFYYGLQLQLMTYMNAAVEMEQSAHSDKQIIPAALLYYHITDPCIQTDGSGIEEQILNEKIMKELRTKGIVNADREVVMLLDKQLSGKSDVIPVELKQSGEYAAASKVMSQEQLKLISDYTELKIKKLAVDILSGNMNVHPFDNGKLCACTYCNYQSICKFDKRLPGFSTKEPPKSSEEWLLEKIREELDEETKNGL